MVSVTRESGTSSSSATSCTCAVKSPLPELALAGVGEHAAVRRDRDPGVERRGAAAVDPLSREPRFEAGIAGGTKGDDQRAGLLQEAAAGQAGVAERMPRVRR
jgi:hypothetical protein